MDSKVPDWHQYFMEIARTVSIRSKDPATKVGAVLVDQDRHIIGTGFNGFAPGVQETHERWQRPIKYQYVVHAEANALLHVTKQTKNATLYTTLYPCTDCAKLIIAAGIKDIYYLDDKYFNEITAAMLKEAGVNISKP